MDSGELNKIAGGVIGAFLLFLLLGFASGKIYNFGQHHGDEPQAFALEIADAAPAGGEEEAIDYAALLASADADAGKKVFGKCRACHKLDDGANAVGPHLYSIIGRPLQAVDGFKYSGALASVGGNWDFAALNAFLEKPKAFAPGTSMGFGGLKKPEDRVNLISYLNEADGSPDALTAPE